MLCCNGMRFRHKICYDTSVGPTRSGRFSGGAWVIGGAAAHTIYRYKLHLASGRDKQERRTMQLQKVLRRFVGGSILLCFSCLLVSRGDAQQYGLEKQKIKPPFHGLNVRIFDKANGQTKWQGNTDSNYFAWSKDKQAIALVEDESGKWKHPWYYRLTVWRSGQPAKTYEYLPPLYAEGIEQLHWSPDDQRLLMLTDGSGGSSDTQDFDLWCLSLRSGKTQHYTNIAAEAQWLDKRHIKWTESVTDAYRRYMQKHPKAKGVISLHPRSYIVSCQ